MKQLNNIHPGEILQKEFLLPLNITTSQFSKDTLITQTIKYFGTQLWLGLQNDFDLEEKSVPKKIK